MSLARLSRDREGIDNVPPRFVLSSFPYDFACVALFSWRRTMLLKPNNILNELESGVDVQEDLIWGGGCAA